MPGITSTAIYIFMTTWNGLFFAYTLGVMTIPVGVRRFIEGYAEPNFVMITWRQPPW